MKLLKDNFRFGFVRFSYNSLVYIGLDQVNFGMVCLCKFILVWSRSVNFSCAGAGQVMQGQFNLVGNTREGKYVRLHGVELGWARKCGYILVGFRFWLELKQVYPISLSDLEQNKCSQAQVMLELIIIWVRDLLDYLKLRLDQIQLLGSHRHPGQRRGCAYLGKFRIIFLGNP